MESGDVKTSTKLKLYSYWRSSCSNRVRIALNLKGLDYEYIPVHLLKDEHKAPENVTANGILYGSVEFLKLNPLGCVPVLVDGEIVVADSYAIIMYLEEKYPQYPLFPQDLQRKAVHNQAAILVSGSIQPYQNLPIITYIKEKLGPDEMLAWVQHHLRKGFSALEKLLEKYAGKYATGDEVFLADLFIAPQIDGAVTRFSIDINEYPLLAKMYESYKEHPAFHDSRPGNQPDTPPNFRD